MRLPNVTWRLAIDHELHTMIQEMDHFAVQKRKKNAKLVAAEKKLQNDGIKMSLEALNSTSVLQQTNNTPSSAYECDRGGRTIDKRPPFFWPQGAVRRIWRWRKGRHPDTSQTPWRTGQTIYEVGNGRLEIEKQLALQESQNIYHAHNFQVARMGIDKHRLDLYEQRFKMEKEERSPLLEQTKNSLYYLSSSPRGLIKTLIKINQN